jgi:hypothetical protein
MTDVHSLLRVWLVIAALAFAMSSDSTLAADSPPAAAPSDNLSSSHGDIDRTTIEHAEPGKEWWRDVVARFPNCATLTDGCQSCVPHADSLTCSNPGIACTRSEWRCSEEIKPQPPPNDEKTAPKQ